MNQALPLYLHKLPHLAELFSHFNAGRHLNRFNDAVLWVELEQEREAYTRLFAALGYELRIDERGFAWFHTDEASSTVSKTTRQLALLFMLIFEYQADAGLNLGRFTEWVLDAACSMRSSRRTSHCWMLKSWPTGTALSRSCAQPATLVSRWLTMRAGICNRRYSATSIISRPWPGGPKLQRRGTSRRLSLKIRPQ